MTSTISPPDNSINQSYATFTRLCDKVNVDNLGNEAQTRLELIDEMVFEVLGWDKHTQVEVEPGTDNGKFIDYLLSVTRKIAVIEAKKVGISFDLPAPSDKVNIVSLKTLLLKKGETAEALEQAMSYSQRTGIPNTIITNGVQYVAFLGSRSDSLPPVEGKAVVFNGMDHINKHFNLFYSIFSPEGLQSSKLKELLTDEPSVRIPKKISSLIPSYPGTRRRNDLQTDLHILSELILEDLMHDSLEESFLKSCYCDSGALSQHSLLARNIITDKYHQDPSDYQLNTQRANNRDGVNPEMMSHAASRRPVILLGDVGVGKTTFIRRLIKVVGKKAFDKGVPIYVNMGESVILTASVLQGITREIREILQREHDIDIGDNDFVRRVYSDEISRFSNGIHKSLPRDLFVVKEVEYLDGLMGDSGVHLKRSLDYISRSDRKVTIFLDNIDQRSTADQQDVYLAAQELAAQTHSVVFVSLRPETFYVSKESGVLKAYHQRAFTIEPPRIDSVLTKRLEFGVRLARGEIQSPSLGGYGSNKLENLSTMLHIMIRSISNRAKRKDLIRFIDNFAAGNVRIAIDMVKDFLSSGHTNSNKIIDIEATGDEYIVPLHEFIRAIIYGENEYYDPESSKVNNLFDITQNDRKEHLLKIVALKLLSILSESATADKGFVETPSLYESLQNLHFLPEQIDACLYYCMKNGLIETSINYVIDKDKSPNRIRVTTKAECYTSLLIHQFQYIDAIIVDTPILDNSIRDLIVEKSATDIFTRTMRAARFVDYIDRIYIDDIENLAPDSLNMFWHSTVREMRSQINYIYEKEDKKRQSARTE